MKTLTNPYDIKGYIVCKQASKLSTLLRRYRQEINTPKIDRIKSLYLRKLKQLQNGWGVADLSHYKRFSIPERKAKA